MFVVFASSKRGTSSCTWLRDFKDWYKGASTYLTSLPGGPPAAAIMLRGGWSMGNVKDRYFKYVDGGDQYCGRCLTTNSVLSVNIASSPPYFDVNQQVDLEGYIEQMCRLQFGQLFDVFGFGKLLRMCVASLVHHRDWFDARLYHSHVLLRSSTILRDSTFVDRMSSHLKVTFPWNDLDHTFSGVPPCASLLQELHSIKTDQRDLITNFVSKVKVALEGFGLDQDRISMETRIKNLLTDFAEKMENLYGRNNNNGNGNDNVDLTEDTPELGIYNW
jgi:hypothetical protein